MLIIIFFIDFARIRHLVLFFHELFEFSAFELFLIKISALIRIIDNRLRTSIKILNK